jgi:hypothetical protein
VVVTRLDKPRNEKTGHNLGVLQIRHWQESRRILDEMVRTRKEYERRPTTK